LRLSSTSAKANSMHRFPFLRGIAVGGVIFATLASPIDAQVAGKVPTISARSFTSGSAKLTVSGSFQVDQDVPLNTKASYGDGEMTWIQFGDSGADVPNVLVTVSSDEIGIIVGRGKRTATVGADACTGKMEVTATTVSGHYTCAGATSFDPSTMKMGKVNIDVRFTSKS